MTNCFVDCSCIVILLGLSILGGCVFYATENDYFKQYPDEPRNMFIWDDKKTEDWDMMVLGERHVEGYNSSNQRPQKSQHVEFYTTNVIFES